MSSTWGVVVGLVVALRSVAVAAPKGDGDAAAAQEAFARGKAAFNAARYDDAQAHFRAGYARKPLPLFLFNIAQASRQAGDLQAAAEYYRDFLKTGFHGREREVAQIQLVALERQLAAERESARPVPPPNEPSKEPHAADPAPRAEPVAAPAPAPRVQAALPAPVEAHALPRVPVYKRPGLWIGLTFGVALVATGVTLAVVYGARDPIPDVAVPGN